MKNLMKAILWTAFIFLVCLLVLSCSSLKKIKNVQRSKSDSTATTSKDSVGKKTTDSSGVRERNLFTFEGTEITFGTEPPYTFNEKDYRPVTDSVARTIIELPGGGRIITNKPLKSVKTQSSKQETTKEQAQKKTEESADTKEQSKTNLKKETVVKDKDVKRTNWWPLLIAVVIVTLIALIILWFRKKAKTIRL